MHAMEIYSDLIGLCEESETCPHATLPHVSEVPGFMDLTEHLIGLMTGHLQTYLAGADEGGESLVNVASHVLCLMAAVGYGIGAEHAYDVTLRSEVTVPDTLAALDFLEPLDGRGGTEAA